MWKISSFHHIKQNFSVVNIIEFKKEETHIKGKCKVSMNMLHNFFILCFPVSIIWKHFSLNDINRKLQTLCAS